MAESSDNLRRFIHRVHRRQLAARVVERIGLSILAGCTVAILLMAILFFRGQPAMPVAIVGLSLSVFAGLICGFIQRPSLLAAAIEADRQLQLADLLSTAWTLHGVDQNDPWMGAILAAADARCAALRSSSVLLGRLNPRIWGGAGLATALMLTIGVMAANPLTSTASGTFSSEQTSGNGNERPDKSQVVFAPAGARNGFTTPGRDPDEEMRNGPGDAMTEESQASDDGHAKGHDNSGGSSASAQGSGAGSAQTSTHNNDHTNLTPIGTGATAASTGHTAAGTGQGTDAATGTGSTGTSAGNQPGGADAPAWTSPDWPADRTAALQAIESRRLPDGYRQMVRAYFDRRGE